MERHVLLATWNEAKVRWMREGLEGLGLPVRALAPGEIADVEETGTTCEANARLKVGAVPPRPGAVVVAEDSGLFVDALDGRPGTRTARWAPGTDDDRARRLLELLKDVPSERRGARFLSAIAIRFDDGRTAVVHGVLEGRVREEPAPVGTGYGGAFEREDGTLLADVPGTGAHRLRALAAAREAIASGVADDPTGTGR